MLQALLFLAPALLLAVLLLNRRYPGERILIAYRVERKRRFARPTASAPRRHRVQVVAVHGGQLIGRSLAVRPPPVFATS